MSAKHSVNGSPAELVADALESLTHLRPGTQFDKQHKSMSPLSPAVHLIVTILVILQCVAITNICRLLRTPDR
jgi:hypothetical protein